jgi:hypothetical protein
MLKVKSVLSVMSFATALATLSLSGLANAQMPSGEPTRAPHPEYFEQKAKRQDKPDCADKHPGEMKRFELKHRAKHAEFKAYIDSLPEAERDYIKSEFKAIREDRVANQRRMDALKERLGMPRSEKSDKNSDRAGKRGDHPRDYRAMKKFNDQSGSCIKKGPKSQAGEHQSHHQHRSHDDNDRHIKAAE